MQSTTAPTVTLITKPGCHLCTLARDVVNRVTSDLGVAFEEQSLAEISDPDPLWWEQIPVTLIDGEIHDYWRVSERRLRSELADRLGAARSA
ncbi:MAG: glutaredoxin family protein [Mobilicoccus sp.]|nr:glutaredoxin family protein [Mobilicoccus sp.]